MSDEPPDHLPDLGVFDAEMSEAVFSEEAASEEGWDQIQFWSVVCPCGAIHGDYPGHSSPELAVACWNTRASVMLDG